MRERGAQRLTGIGMLLLVAGLPWLGAWLAGRDLSELLRFPPVLNIPADYARFSWGAAGAVGAVLAATLFWWLRGARGPAAVGGEAGVGQESRIGTRPARFAWWGWAAVVWTLGWWVLAWNRFAWFADWQRFTFFPLWVGFIVTVNALTDRRVGTCWIRRAPGAWLGLFIASAVFWWVFEWLNRFVRNWHYLGVEDFGSAGYAVHASLCFSTVLPAVAAVAEWIGTHAWWREVTARGPVWRGLERRGAAVAWGGAGVLALGFTGAFPEWTYPALWVAPLGLLLGAAVRAGPGGVVHELVRGDWSRAASWMVAALVCGVFWELWNWHSAAKWIYTVPGVERWHVFEMPLLGYAGYLPFGLECLLVVERLGGGGGYAVTRVDKPRASAQVRPAPVGRASRDRPFNEFR